MLDQPNADPQIVLQHLELTAHFVGRRGSFANFLFDRRQASHGFVETGQNSAHLLRCGTDQSKAQRLDPLSRLFNFRTHHR